MAKAKTKAGSSDSESHVEYAARLNVTQAYKSRTLSELNALVPKLNKLKDKLNVSIQYYRDNYGKYNHSDPGRLCVALGIPGSMGEQIRKKESAIDYKAIEQQNINNSYQIYQRLLRSLNIDLRTKSKREATITDANELYVYLRMQSDIDIAKRNDPEYAEKFPYDNPFKYIFDMMSISSALIIRFRYVSRNRSAPEEKPVSYHPLRLKDGVVLGTHVHGDKTFSMSRLWGEGDEMLKPLYKKYKSMIIRWGKKDVIDALNGKRTTKEFLY